MDVLLTVPHGRCPSGSGPRRCDRLAENAARALKEKLEENGIGVELLVADVLRELKDENRPGGPPTAFSEKLSGLAGNARLVLDVHSFPRGSFQGARTPMVLLDPVGFSRDDTVASLARRLGEDTVVYMPGSVVNHVVVLSRRLGTPAALLEFREDLSDSELDELASRIASWARDRLGSSDADGDDSPVSPVDGIVEQVSEREIVLYVAPEDDHRVRSPFSTSYAVGSEAMTFDRPSGVFRAEPPKTERVTFEALDGDFGFALEVGKPRYITNNVRVEKSVLDGAEAPKGSLVAEILIGSRAIVFWDADRVDEIFVRKGDRVRAGETPLLRLTAPRTNGCAVC